MTSIVNLRPVITVLQELVDSVVTDESQRAELRSSFLRHLEDAEHTLLLDLQNTSPSFASPYFGSPDFSSSKGGDESLLINDGLLSRNNDVIVTHRKAKEAKQRLEDVCLADIARVAGDTKAHHMVNAVRRLCAQDLMKENEEMLVQSSHESSRLLMPLIPKDGTDWFKELTKYVPIIKWAKNYRWRYDLPGDLFAGCTVAFMTFPQTMGYAILAGLPPIYGLYSSFVPVFIYSILGTSAEMSVGPAAMVALMIPDTLGPLAPVGSPLYILYATFLSFFSGIILFGAGLLNGGFIVENILSVPLLTGWIQGAAVLIVLSQMSGFFQIHIPSTSNTVVTVIKSISETIKDTNGWSVLVGGVCLVLLFGSRKIGETRRFSFIKKLPISLVVLIVVTLLSYLQNWEDNLHLAIIGKIPQGLPSPKFFSLSWELIGTSFKAALAIAIIGFMEGISLAKKFAGLRKYRIDVSQELRALGLANMIGSCFRAFPVTGSVTRTTVNYQSGSRTTFSSIVNGLLVGAVLLFLSRLFYYTPKTALAAIVISAGLSLIDIHEIQFLWRIKAKYDLAQLLGIFLVTLFTGPETGALVTILISVLQIIYRSTRPVCVSMGPVSGTSVYKAGTQFSKTITKKGILVVRLDSGLYFYTTAWLKENLFTWESESPIQVKAIVLDASAISSADSTGVHGLMEIIDEYKKKSICVFFSNVPNALMETMELAGLLEKVGPDSFFGTTHEAVQVANTLSHSERLRLTVTLN